MSKQTVVTAANFTRTLSDAIRSVKAMRDKVQTLIAFAAQHYAGEGNGNALFLTKILDATLATPGLNTRGIQAYIQEVANVRYIKDSTGAKVFAKVKKDGDNPAVCNSNVLATPWYQWVKENLGGNNAQADWSLEKYIKAVVAVLKKHDANVDDAARMLRRAA